MITCHSVQRIYNLDFSSYLLLPQYSHSYLKSEKNGHASFKAATPKMQIGSIVDAMLTGGYADMNSELYPDAKKIAVVIERDFGWAISKIDKQVSMTGIMRLTLGGATFELQIKGRPDYECRTMFIMDLKVTAERLSKIDSNISFMGYPNQQFGYAKQADVKKSYLLIYSRKDKEAIVKPIAIGDTNKWWEEKIIKFGKAIL